MQVEGQTPTTESLRAQASLQNHMDLRGTTSFSQPTKQGNLCYHISTYLIFVHANNLLPLIWKGLLLKQCVPGGFQELFQKYFSVKNI